MSTQTNMAQAFTGVLRGCLGVLLAALLAPVALAATKAPAAPVRPAPVAARVDLPHYTPPPAFSEDLVITTEGRTIVMKRAIDSGRTRTEMAFDGNAMVTIEAGDEAGTTYMLMPDQKRAMKMSRGAVVAEAKKHEGQAPPDSVQAAPAYRAEDLGEETIDDVVTRKMRLITDEASVLAWFDKASGAPVRMESTSEGKPVVMEWKARKAGAQPAELFEVPKNYELTDMDEMKKKMGSMGGMGGLGGMAKGMGAGMAGGMLGGMGGGIGGQLGGMIGGPMGSIAGRYIGGKIGNALAHKAVGGTP
ncbi:MAG: hypothetical protein ABI960_03305 [Candidatus Eisenbacteria bacterium]